MTEPETTRLNKHLALQLGVSRREADILIEKGQVKVNDTDASLGVRIQKEDIVTVKGKNINNDTEYQYLVLNKPVGYVCSRKPQGASSTVYELLPSEYHTLKLVGRLDRDSSGLIMLTNDGDFAFRMTHPKFAKTKVYHVQLDHNLEPLHQQMISDYGVQLEDGISKFTIMRLEPEPSRSTPLLAKYLQPEREPTPELDTMPGAKPFSEERGSEGEQNKDEKKSLQPTYTYEITMHEGRNRQIRRTFTALGYDVKKLHRTNFGNYSLGDIEPGDFKIVDMQ